MYIAWWRYVVDWVPFLIFISLLVYFMIRMRRQQAPCVELWQEQVTQLRRIGDQLERLAAASERRNQP